MPHLCPFELVPLLASVPLLTWRWAAVLRWWCAHVHHHQFARVGGKTILYCPRCLCEIPLDLEVAPVVPRRTR